MMFVVALTLVVIGIVLLTIRPQRGASEVATKAYGVVAIVIACAIILYKSAVVIPAGHVGVVDFFGRVSPNTLKPGIRLVNPIANVIRMNVKTQEIKETANVPTQEGLTINLEISVL